MPAPDMQMGLNPCGRKGTSAVTRAVVVFVLESTTFLCKSLWIKASAKWLNVNMAAIFSIFSPRPPLSDPGPKAGIQTGSGTGDRLASHDTHQPQGDQGQGHVSRKSLHVDVGGTRTGRSPSVSPDRGSVPTSPYSVPQIAPMPSSKLCPVCKTTDLMGAGDNFNTCTQCRCKVCSQCGFNPNPHLTEVRLAESKHTFSFIWKFMLCQVS